MPCCKIASHHSVLQTRSRCPWGQPVRRNDAVNDTEENAKTYGLKATVFLGSDNYGTVKLQAQDVWGPPAMCFSASGRQFFSASWKPRNPSRYALPAPEARNQYQIQRPRKDHAAVLALALCPAGPAMGDNVDGALVFGLNGGVTTQVFSPGSVIILSRFADPEDNLPSEMQRDRIVARNHAIPGRLQFSLVPEPRIGALDVTGFFEGIAFSEDQSATDIERASKTDGSGGVVGLTLGGDRWSAIVSVDHLRQDTDFDEDTFFWPEQSTELPLPGASAERKELGLSIGGSWQFANGVMAFGAARASIIDVETSRTYFELVNLVSSSPSIKGSFDVEGDTDGWSAGLSAGLAYARPLGQGFFGGFTGSVNWTKEVIDGYTETSEVNPIGRATVTYEEDNRTSLVSRIGTRISRPIAFNNGVFVPHVRAAWLHEFRDDSRSIAVTTETEIFGADPVSEFSSQEEILTNKPDRDYFTVGLGFTVDLNEGRTSLFVDYERVVEHRYLDTQTLRVGGEFRF